MAAGVIDFAIDVLGQQGKEIHRVPLLSDIYVVVREGHPAVRDHLDLDLYLSQSHILASSRRTGLGIEDMTLAGLDRHRHIALRCQQYYAACRVVCETDLLLTMPEHYARMVNLNMPTRILPVPMEMAPTDIFLYWHENVNGDPTNIWMSQSVAADGVRERFSPAGKRPPVSLSFPPPPPCFSFLQEPFAKGSKTAAASGGDRSGYPACEL